jgi:hypothetical protein
VLSGWDARDVAVHLLGNDLGRLHSAATRVSDAPDPAFDDLARRIEAANEAWVAAGRRIPTDLLVRWLETTGQRVDDLFGAMDPWQPGVGVAWTGTGPSPAWLDIAREYTELWMHGQHIALALGWPGRTERHWLWPVIDAFMRALPRAYEATRAAAGKTVRVEVTGEAGGTWTVRRDTHRWRLIRPEDAPTEPDAAVTLSDDVAWRVFSRFPGATALRGSIARRGEDRLAEPATRALAVMTSAADDG